MTSGLARPPETLELVARFSDHDLRDATSVVILIHWMKRDRAAAEAWLAKSEISADVRKRAEAGFASSGARPPGGPEQPGSQRLEPAER
jgi:hypothetical protein